MFTTQEQASQMTALHKGMADKDPSDNFSHILEFTELFQKGFGWDQDQLNVDAVVMACQLFLARVGSITDRAEMLEKLG